MGGRSGGGSRSGRSRAGGGVTRNFSGDAFDLLNQRQEAAFNSPRLAREAGFTAGREITVRYDGRTETYVATGRTRQVGRNSYTPVFEQTSGTLDQGRGRLTTGASLVSPVMRVLNSRIQVNFTN